MPVFLGHGTSDPLIPLALAQSTTNLLRQKGFSALDFRTYPGVQHSIGPQELQAIRDFIQKVLPEQTAKAPTLYVSLVQPACIHPIRKGWASLQDCFTLTVVLQHHSILCMQSSPLCRVFQEECEGSV